MKAPNWSLQERALLEKMWRDNASSEALKAVFPSRTDFAIAKRAYKDKLGPKGPENKISTWQKIVTFLDEHPNQFYTPGQIHKMFDGMSYELARATLMRHATEITIKKVADRTFYGRVDGEVYEPVQRRVAKSKKVKTQNIAPAMDQLTAALFGR
jgi:hypothetical protein